MVLLVECVVWMGEIGVVCRVDMKDKEDIFETKR